MSTSLMMQVMDTVANYFAVQCWGPVAVIGSQIIQPGLSAVRMMEM